MINLLHRNDRFVRVHNIYTKITTAKLSAFCISCAKTSCCVLVFRFLYAGSSMQNTSEQFISCILFSFVNFALRLAPKNKNVKHQRIGMDEQYAPDSNSYISVTIQN
jgi:hypothetical protein